MGDLTGIAMVLVTNALVRIPLLVLWAATIYLALTRHDLPRRVTSLALAGGVTLLVVELVFGIGAMALPLVAARSGASMAAIGGASMVISLVSTLVHTAGLGLLVAAIFAKRTPDVDPTLASPR